MEKLAVSFNQFLYKGILIINFLNIFKSGFVTNIFAKIIIDANVQSDVKINLAGADKSEACRRSGTCAPQPPKSSPSAPQLASPEAQSALQTLQQLINQSKTQNPVAKDTATVLVNGVPVKIPLGK